MCSNLPASKTLFTLPMSASFIEPSSTVLSNLRELGTHALSHCIYKLGFVPSRADASLFVNHGSGVTVFHSSSILSRRHQPRYLTSLCYVSHQGSYQTCLSAEFNLSLFSIVTSTGATFSRAIAGVERNLNMSCKVENVVKR